jgi:hypothetical protein
VRESLALLEGNSTEPAPWMDGLIRQVPACTTTRVLSGLIIVFACVCRSSPCPWGCWACTYTHTHTHHNNDSTLIYCENRLDVQRLLHPLRFASNAAPPQLWAQLLQSKDLSVALLILSTVYCPSVLRARNFLLKVHQPGSPQLRHALLVMIMLLSATAWCAIMRRTPRD